MNYLKLFFVIILFIGCNPNPKANQAEKDPNSVSVGTITVGPLEFIGNCVKLDDSFAYYPEITGMNDEVFQSELNAILKGNFYSELNSYKSDSSIIWCNDFLKMIDEAKPVYDSSDFYPYISLGFNVPTCNDSFITIVQVFSYDQGITGGTATHFTTLINTIIDVKNKVIINDKELGSGFSIDFLNKKIEAYFQDYFKDQKDEYFPESFDQAYITLDGGDYRQPKYDELKFTLRNDSVIMILHATPWYDGSRGDYEIPIDKYKRRDGK